MNNHPSRSTPSIWGTASSFIFAWLERFTTPWFKPRPGLNRLEEHHKARNVAALLLAMSIALVIRTAFTSDNRSWPALFTLVVFGTYLMARTRYYPLATWAMVIILPLPSYLRVLTLPIQEASVAVMTRSSWLAFSLVLGGLVFSGWNMVLLTGLHMASIALLAWLRPGIEWTAIAPTLGFVAVLGATIIIAGHAHNRLGAERHAQDLRRERQLDEVAQAISSALDLPTVLQTIVRNATQLAAAEAGILSLLSTDRERMETVLGYNMPEEQVNSRPPKGQGLAWHIIETGAPIILDNYHSHPKALTNLTRGLFAYLGVPVLDGETCLGALAVATTDRHKCFTPRDQELLEALARQAGIAIRNARLYSQLENELAERCRVETALRQREAILEAVASAAGQFLQSQDWPRYIQTVLAELGQITHSSHAYIFQNHPGPRARLVTSQLYQWTAPGTEPTLERAEFQNVPLEGPGLERWRDAMLHGEPFYGGRSTWQSGEAQYLGPLGAQSILEMPVYLQSTPGNPPGEVSLEWWGVIGFDDYTTERVWLPAEIDAIKIAASILSAAIQRQRADQAVQETSYRANLALEKRVQERTVALQLANKEMEAFAYSVSHDLRAPLRAIDGYSQILLEDYANQLSEDGRTCLENVRQSTKKMNQLIDDLLQLSRVTRQTMEMVPVNLSDLANELVEAHTRQEADRAVQVTVQAGLEAIGDSTLLRLALENLISNAWKFTRQTGNARIEVGQVEGSASPQPVYFVRDNGAGFDMQYAARLFQPFQRLHNPDEFEGTGVGLATVQRIMQRHNGRLWAEGAPNQGATFYFTIGSADDSTAKRE